MEGTLATIIAFAGNFAPRNWALCQGQLMAVNTNQAVFSLLGTMYGGDGRSTFALPNLIGRTPIGTGTGTSYGHKLTPRRVGDKGGSETTVMDMSHMPAHTHQFDVSKLSVATSATLATSAAAGNNNKPAGDSLGQSGTGAALPYDSAGNEGGGTLAGVGTTLNLGGIPVGTLGNTGGSPPKPITNMQPYLAMNYIICLAGIYPSRW